MGQRVTLHGYVIVNNETGTPVTGKTQGHLIKTGKKEERVYPDCGELVSQKPFGKYTTRIDYSYTIVVNDDEEIVPSSW